MYREQIVLYSHEVIEYDRKSRSDDPLLSVEEVLERHGRILNEYAVQNLGGPIPEENKYKEVGSGESIDSRPEMLRLLKAVENPRIKAVMVVDVQRLSRGDLEDAGRLIKILRYTNTYVVTPMKIYDLRDEYDRDAFERELKKGNEYLEYFKKIQERGKLASIKEGNYIGSAAPFGYDRAVKFDGKKQYHTLVENKEEADAVRMIFNWYCTEDIGATAICRRLESLGIRTKTGKKYWKCCYIFSILENVHYIGCVRWNWRKTVVTIEDQEVKKLRPKAKIDEYLIFNGKHEGIVSEELFYKAREIRGKRHRTKTNTSLVNPFSGIMFCAKCGRKIGYNVRSRKPNDRSEALLRCNNQVHCKNGSVRFDEVLSYVCKSLKECIEDFEVRVSSGQDDSVKLHKNIVENLEKRLEELKQREIEQWESQFKPELKMPTEIFQKLNEKLLIEKDEVQQALDKAKESIPEPVNYEDKILRFTDALEALEDPNVDAKIKNAYLRDIIERIDFEREPSVRLNKQNCKQFGVTLEKGIKHYHYPYQLTITLKAP